ncbi:MAG: uracil-DNA glycosylase, partial [Candidatus Omnitrophica bacterium]|nr:uracil-DNA glycosylase [Candidatus Omnitrophota bacterium]
MPKSKIQEAKNFIQTLKEENVEEIYLKEKVSAPVPTGSGKREQLLKLRESALKCVLCDELASTRKSVVFGAGNVNARLVFVGEAP